MILLIVGCNNSSSNSSKEETSQKTIFFPTQNKSLVMMETRLAGILQKDSNGCLRVNEDLIIWPYGSKLKNNLIYDKDGNLIAEIGESVTFSGGGISLDENLEKEIKQISNMIPNPQCSDPYFFLDSILY